MKRRTLFRGAAIGAAAIPAAAFGYSALAEPTATAANYEVSITEQRTNRLLNFKRGSAWTDANITWSWSPGGGGWSNLSDVKYRNTASFGWIALATASGGKVGIVNMTSEKHQELNDLLWSATPGGNPHAIERIPDIGAIVTASSAGFLTVYGPTAVSKPSTLAKVQTVTLAGAHGVLWDPTRKLLWAIGDKVLRAYQVTGSYRNTRLKATSKKVTLKGLGHDLQPDYSDKGKLLITDTYGAYEVNASTLAKKTVREGRLIKSYVRDSAGEGMWLQAKNNEPRPWSSDTVRWDSGSKVRSGGHIYKARIVTTSFN
ncbi:DUF6528 family protein [Stackebrandtia soli]|uniref:DUF6528 family protein n=1 Tax=Stackebrandtia soli TaxID=1892856 RepID=UPI0039EC0C44